MVLITYFSSGGGDGAEVIYALRNNNRLSSMVAKELENAGQNVRKYYQRRLPSNPSKDYYFMHRDTPNNETIIVEYGFADSKGDDVNQLKYNWEQLAEAVVKAVTEYAGGTYVPPTGSNYYIVKSGDTLWNIAKNNNISVNELKEANNLTSNALSIGQALIIPSSAEEKAPTGDYYIVKSGDTLYSISKNNNLTVDELKKLNNLTSNSLSIGQKLILKPITTSANQYTVVKGDSLYAIAKKFNTTVDEIKKLNNLTSNNLSIGQVLNIPGSSTSTTNKIYTVKKGDTLYKIASNNNTTVNAIKSLNNLTTNNLSIGQVLQIPN